MKASVGLADAVEALREELILAMTRGKGKAMRFSLEPVELTIQVAVTKNASGQVGWMVLEASGEYERVTTQSLTLRLTPLWEKEDGTLSRDFAIASKAIEGDIIGPRKLAAD